MSRVSLSNSSFLLQPPPVRSPPSPGSSQGTSVNRAIPNSLSLSSVQQTIELQPLMELPDRVKNIFTRIAEKIRSGKLILYSCLRLKKMNHRLHLQNREILIFKEVLLVCYLDGTVARVITLCNIEALVTGTAGPFASDPSTFLVLQCKDYDLCLSTGDVSVVSHLVSVLTTLCAALTGEAPLFRSHADLFSITGRPRTTSNLTISALKRLFNSYSSRKKVDRAHGLERVTLRRPRNMPRVVEPDFPALEESCRRLREIKKKMEADDREVNFASLICTEVLGEISDRDVGTAIPQLAVEDMRVESRAVLPNGGPPAPSQRGDGVEQQEVGRAAAECASDAPCTLADDFGGHPGSHSACVSDAPCAPANDFGDQPGNHIARRRLVDPCLAANVFKEFSQVVSAAEPPCSQNDKQNVASHLDGQADDYVYPPVVDCPVGSLLICTVAYQPTAHRNDEMTLVPGDIVVVMAEFRDYSWLLVQLLRPSAAGTFNRKAFGFAPVTHFGFLHEPVDRFEEEEDKEDYRVACQ